MPHYLSIDDADAITTITAGQMTGLTSLTGEMTSVNTNMNSGDIAIVKIGEKSIKMVVK